MSLFVSFSLGFESWRLVVTIICFHSSLFLASSIQSFILSEIIPRLLVRVLLKLFLTVYWGLPIGLGCLWIHDKRIFLGPLLWFIFANFCNHLERRISMYWWRLLQFPNQSLTHSFEMWRSFTSYIVIPAILLKIIRRSSENIMDLIF